MKRTYVFWLFALVALLVSGTQARADLSNYVFEASHGSAIALGEGKPLVFYDDWGENFDDGVTEIQDIGFTFYFDGIPYTTFSVTTNGLVGLGDKPASACWGNDLANMGGTCYGLDYAPWRYQEGPRISPFWDDLRVTDDWGWWEGSVTSTVVGSAPNRIRVISFNGVETTYYWELFSTWQVRIYEGSNKVEIYYEDLNSLYFDDGGSIGLANERGFLSVVPQDGGNAFATSDWAYNEYYPSDVVMPPGTLYSFTPCNVSFEGNIDEGGTENMAEGDTLLLTKGVEVFSSATFHPVGLVGPASCGEKKFSIEIEGDEYTVSPSSGVIDFKSGTWPTITFTPVRAGRRLGRITITEASGLRISYILAAEGIPRIKYIGDLAEGGTSSMATGDILMQDIHVRRGLTGQYQPFTVVNTSKNPDAPPAIVTFAVRRVTGGQYSIDITDASLPAGEEVTPTITFSPTGVGPIRDTLLVTADGVTNVYPLHAIADARGGEFMVGGSLLGPASQLFVNEYGCVGNGELSIPIQVNNIGNLPFQVSKLIVYRTDTTYKQGEPAYSLIRDKSDQLVSANDYVLRDHSGAPLSLPITLAVGESQTFLLTFVGAEPGKRFARAYLYTNDEVVSGKDANGQVVDGLRVFDLFARGYGAQLAGDANGTRIRHVVFPDTRVGTTALATLEVFNPGRCDLRISLANLQISGGDVDEFAVVSTPPPTSQGDELLVKPGDRAEFVFSFTPKQNGSRRATLRLQTNDSTLHVPGITERGVFYLNLYGGGETGMFVETVAFAQTLIGGDASEWDQQVARVVNTNPVPLTLADIQIEGDDKDEFRENPLQPWTALPRMLMPGEELEIGLVFAPAAGGQTGPRTATLRLSTVDGKEVSATLHGVAGTRTALANPGAISFPMTTTGKYQRRMVSITNTGTMPVQLQQPEVVGPDGTNFHLATMDRLRLAAGQTEYVEVTYQPTVAGTISATLEFGGNMTNGPAQIQLGGTAVKSKKGNDPIDMVDGRGGVIEDGVSGRDGFEDLSVSGVETSSSGHGMSLGQSVPNPAQHQVQISYGLAQGGEIELALYDEQGRLVRLLDNGYRAPGEQSVRVDVSDLAKGTYFYRLTANGQTRTRSLQILR